MDRFEFIRAAWHLAKDKAHQINWTVPAKPRDLTGLF
jgi:hypothetical protein